MNDALATPARIGVTGGLGFLGSHLVPRLLVGGGKVRILDRAPRAPWSVDEAVEVIHADVTHRPSVQALVSGLDVVIHAAFAPPQVTPQRLQQVNVEGTVALCQAAVAAGVRQIILVSSTIVTARPRRHPLSSRLPLSRLDAYRTTRAEAERVAAAAQREVELAVVRPKTFVGPGRVGSFALLFDQIRRGGVVPLAGKGSNRYQLLDVRDLSDGIARLAEQGGSGLYEFGATEFGTVADDLGALIAAAGTGARLRAIPGGRALVRSLELAGLPPLAEWHHCTARDVDSIVDVSRAQHDLGWRPARSNIEALSDAYRWYAAERATREAVPTTHPVPSSHRLLRRLADRVLR